MTPKEKADELAEKFLPIVRGADSYNYNLESMNLFIARQCAIIAVDEVMNSLKAMPYGVNYLQRRDYWEGVKEELSKAE